MYSLVQDLPVRILWRDPGPIWVQGRTKYSAFDYSDVPRSTSLACLRHVGHTRDGREAVDNGRLGLWCGQPDHVMQRSKRRTDPLRPVYDIHGQQNAMPAHIGKVCTLRACSKCR